jgi:4-hydroxy-2-oxoheptanedioate aldolase
MRSTSAIGAALAATLVLSGVPIGRAQTKQRLNPVIDLLEHNRPVFGVYWPSNGGGRRGADVPARPAGDLARDALGYTATDFLFSGSMEGGVDRGYAAYAEFARALVEAGDAGKSPFFGLRHPLVVKTPKIATDSVKAVDNISRELNVGASGIMFVEVESADEVRQGLAAMRFKSRSGTRPDEVGGAPAFWGMSEQQYRQKADLWPLNPDGELINWTIVESREGLAHVREIAAVKGIGVLWPGAGTLRGVFSTTNAAGERVVDTVAHENAIQQVLAACKEFKVPCGYPANANDIETRMKQGFSVFVMNWGDAGFSTVDIGRKAAGRVSTQR